MCGICGEWYLDSSCERVEAPRLSRMNRTLRHRGPDGHGIYLYGAHGGALLDVREGVALQQQRGRVGLAHRRLSIIDLATGSQPMSNEDRSIWVVFNGEIYNFRELRTGLQARGHCFSTRSDTEVLVHLYEERGEDFVRWLKGMFAFALWDARCERILLARDQVGIKPLFYTWDGQRLLFASELKALAAVMGEQPIDYQAVHDYLSLNYIPGPRTIYRDIFKLQPGHLLIGDRNGFRVRAYWDVPFGAAPIAEGKPLDLEQAAADLLERLRQAVRAQMVSEVPLGVFLSGGLDSSTLVALASEASDRPVRTFSIGFKDPSYSELSEARLVASQFGTDHTDLVLDHDAREIVPKLVNSFDEPFADSSAIPTYYVSQLARSRVAVVLGGDGGDEVFAGYHTYVAARLAQYYRRVPRVVRRGLLRPLVHLLPSSEAKLSIDYMAKRFVAGAEFPDERAHFSWKEIFTEDAKAALYADAVWPQMGDSFENYERYFSQCSRTELLDRLQYVDMKVYLPDDILVKVDRMSMAHSLEVRVPFLDLEVMELAASLPAAARLNGWTKKYILKQAVRKLLPRQIADGRKRGFNVPIARWMRRELSELVYDYLAPGVVARHGWFKPERVTDLVRLHNSGTVDCGRKLWALLILSMWREQQRTSAAEAL
jgi:asparagine synthase (glutamine-hydrolysing)